MHTIRVAEIQGLYGPFTLSERVIQKIWLRQDFSLTDLKTASGKRLIVKNPGRWNFYEGPDFKEARLVLDDIEVVGDVEVHFSSSDWHHHRHENDKNYDHVVLHVVLHLNRADQVSQVQTSKGHTPEMFYLMPVLDQDLESYAMEDALLELEQQDELEWVARFVELSKEVRLQVLRQKAENRWRQKLVYARQRLQAEGWEHACHQYALEVFGYKRNRAPMLRLAMRYSIAQMRIDLHERQTLNAEHRMKESGLLKTWTLDADRLFDEEAKHWKLNGMRPANHPRQRLAQYLDLVSKQPYWPDRLIDCLKTFPEVAKKGETGAFRKAVGLSRLYSEIRESVFCSVISEKRLNTLIVDAILPLATAADLLDGLNYWMHWLPGDCPNSFLHFLRQAGVINRQNPHNNGFNQGVLALFLEGGARRC